MPVMPGGLESYVTSPGEEAVVSIPALHSPPQTKFRLSSASFINFANGLNDSALGALIPYMEADYEIGYAIVSLIFVTNALYFILAALFTHALEMRLGRSNTYSFSMSLLAAGYVIIPCKPPFPAVVACFFLLGLGITINLALNNVFCADLVNSTAALGGLGGAYGIGKSVGPLVATALASHDVRWSYYYSINLAMSLVNLTFAAWSFRKYEEDLLVQFLAALHCAASHQMHDPNPPGRTYLLKQALKDRSTLLGALTIFAYQGAEGSISG